MAARKRIQILPPELANQIAAGEVVERPASVLKELVENSIDAGATRIDVEIRHGGQGYIRVQDDGHGMAAEDLELAVTRHATSKISSVTDLTAINSFGFRGEALASIGSVSLFSIASVPQGEVEASRLEVEYGRTGEIAPTALAKGTLIEIRDLFANVPARLKFLKTETTETKRCQEAVTRIALANPHIGFTFATNGRKTFDFPSGQTLMTRLEELWPPSVCEGLMEAQAQVDGMRIHGVVGDPMKAQGRGDRILLYANSRPVQDKTMIAALREAYKGRLLAREHPQAVLFLELPAEEMDVNVHPAKLEVRFRDERVVFSLVRKAVLNALDAADHIQSYGSPAAMEPVAGPSQAHEGSSNEGWEQDESLSPRHAAYRTFQEETQHHLDLLPSSGKHNLPYAQAHDHSSQGHGEEHPRATAPPKAVAEEQIFSEARPDPADCADDSDGAEDWSASHNVSNHIGTTGLAITTPANSNISASPTETAGQPSANRQIAGFEYLGQIADTYLVLRLQDGSLGLLDQHAAHERILFSAMRQRGMQGNSRALALPLKIVLHPSEQERLEELWQELQKLGFRLETHSGTVSIAAIPPSLEPGQAKDYLKAALADQSRSIEDLWIMLSCRSALKAGEALAPAEALALIESWAATDERMHCPHGRPALVRMGLGELEKLFKRRG